jgi:hypothetical protein
MTTSKPMTAADRETLRARVQAEPADARGDLARALMAEVDRLHEQKEQQDRTALIASYTQGHHLTIEEATRYVDLRPSPRFEFEHGPCRACKGTGGRESGCFGGKWSVCGHCHGRGKCTRLRLPWDPHGQTVPIEV